MWDPAWWCCARKTDSLDLADRTDRTDRTGLAGLADRTDSKGGHNQDYMYVTDLLNDVYSADRKGLSDPNGVARGRAVI
jgi:hypothetical protein